MRCRALGFMRIVYGEVFVQEGMLVRGIREERIENFFSARELSHSTLLFGHCLQCLVPDN
jgi:hypothetical protein